jgi:hypothetical protein
MVYLPAVTDNFSQHKQLFFNPAPGGIFFIFYKQTRQQTNDAISTKKNPLLPLHIKKNQLTFVAARF